MNVATSAQSFKSDALPTQFGWNIAKKPKVAVVITHYNYSEFIEAAIESVLCQTYAETACIIVDDFSDSAHKRRLNEIASNGKKNIDVIYNSSNIGQIRSFYEGVKRLDADFYCLLDPDDRYFPTFVEEMIYIHLNPYKFVPLVCCDQLYSCEERQITGVYLNHKQHLLDTLDLPATHPSRIQYFDWRQSRWPWSSTSAMMFRRDALRIMRPGADFSIKRAADAYLGHGSRYMGGSIVFDKPLVMRGIHKANSYLDAQIISSAQTKKRQELDDAAGHCAESVLANILENGGLVKFSRAHFRKIIRKEFSYEAMQRLISKSPNARSILSKTDLFKSMLHEIRRFGKKNRRKLV